MLVVSNMVLMTIDQRCYFEAQAAQRSAWPMVNTRDQGYTASRFFVITAC